MPLITKKYANLRSLPWPKTAIDGRILNLADSYAVGRLIVNEIYGGQRSLERGKKNLSLRSIAETILPRMSASTLMRCVQVFETAQHLPIAIINYTNITAGHLFRVHGLKPRDQVRLITRANREKWSVARMSEEVKPLKLKKYSGKNAPGRPSKPVFMKVLDNLNPTLLRRDLSKVHVMDRSSVEDVVAKASKLNGELFRVIEAAQIRLQDLKTSDSES